MLLADFRRNLLHPAHTRCEELRAQIAEGETELRALYEVPDYDDEAAAAVQAQLADLARALARWQRRYSYLTSREAAQSGGRVEV